jgi:hypothetical protein
MRSVNYETIEWKGHASHRTKSGVQMKRLLQGGPGPLNYELTTVRPVDDYTTPRHRHNFEQFMYVINGRWEFGEGDEGAATDGMIGFIPEGSYYGPQRLVADSYVITLQFGGASGLGFLAYEQWYQAHEELSAVGRFEGGRYYSNDAPENAEGQDAAEAIWEHSNQRKIEYPPARYSRPFAINPDAFRWEATDVGARRRLGTFTERQWSLDIYRWDGHGDIELGTSQLSLAILLEGSATVDGKDFPRLSAFEVDRDERLTITAETGAQLLCVTMADFANFEAAEAPDAVATAAS